MRAITIILLCVVAMMVLALWSNAEAQIGGDCCQNPEVGKQSFLISVPSVATTLLLTPSSNEGVHVCGVHFTEPVGLTNAVGVQFLSSASASCTSPTSLTGAMTVGITAPAGYTEFSTPAGYSLCIKTTGTNVDPEGWGTYCLE